MKFIPGQCTSSSSVLRLSISKEFSSLVHTPALSISFDYPLPPKKLISCNFNFPVIYFFSPKFLSFSECGNMNSVKPSQTSLFGQTIKFEQKISRWYWRQDLPPGTQILSLSAPSPGTENWDNPHSWDRSLQAALASSTRRVKRATEKQCVPTYGAGIQKRGWHPCLCKDLSGKQPLSSQVGSILPIQTPARWQPPSSCTAHRSDKKKLFCFSLNPFV